MKFKTPVDQFQFNMLKLDEMEVRKRLIKTSKAKDRKRSKAMKDHWRRNKAQLQKGIEKWHKSTKGKRFHRALGRFNALRETAGYVYHNDLVPGATPSNNGVKHLSMDQVNDALLSLSSIGTHLNLELQYYEPDPEAMSQFLEIMKMFQEDSSYLNAKLIMAYSSGEIDMDDYILLNDIIQFFQDPKMYVYAKRELEGFSNDTDTIDFVEQVRVAESIDHTVAGNETYEVIDKLFIK